MYFRFKKQGLMTTLIFLLTGLLLMGCQNKPHESEAPPLVDEMAQQTPYKTNCVAIGQLAYRAYKMARPHDGKLQVVIGAESRPYARGFVNMYASSYGSVAASSDASEYELVAQCIAQQDEIEQMLQAYTDDVRGKIAYMALVVESMTEPSWAGARAKQLEDIKAELAQQSWTKGVEETIVAQYASAFDAVVANPEKLNEEQLVELMPQYEIIFERLTLEEAGKRLKELAAKTPEGDL